MTSVCLVCLYQQIKHKFEDSRRKENKSEYPINLLTSKKYFEFELVPPKKDVYANRRNANTLVVKAKTMQKAVRRDGLAAESLLVNIFLIFFFFC